MSFSHTLNQWPNWIKDVCESCDSRRGLTVRADKDGGPTVGRCKAAWTCASGSDTRCPAKTEVCRGCEGVASGRQHRNQHTTLSPREQLFGGHHNQRTRRRSGPAKGARAEVGFLAAAPPPVGQAACNVLFATMLRRLCLARLLGEKCKRAGTIHSTLAELPRTVSAGKRRGAPH